MGSGKTTVGRRLASELERPFVDADEVLEERSGRTIAEIFATDGEEAFRDLEAQVLQDLLDRDDAPVIASGGGVVVREGNRRALTERDDVLVVWLTASPGFLASRVEQAAQQARRPLLAGEPSPQAVLERLSAERGPLYEEVADLEVVVQPSHEPSQPSQLRQHRERPRRIGVEDLAQQVRDWDREPWSVQR
jgi:shikimate kinase